MKKRIGAALGLVSLIAAAAVVAAAGGAKVVAYPAAHPLVGDYALVSTSTTPPTEAQCFTVNAPSGRRCFTPQNIYAAYNLKPLYTNGITGTGHTIAIVDSYGSDTMASDLNVFDTAFGLPHMCGEVDANGPIPCSAGMPTFSQLDLQGSPATKPQGNGKGIGLEDKTGWALEVVLDVEWAHAIAPGANILLVHTPTAETLGVQGLPQMMKAEDYVVTHHLADVISQSFGSSELAFGSPQSLLNLRNAFQDAKDDHVTVLASSGDFGSTNETKQSLTGAGADVIQQPNVGWPGSDPLVTSVGGTYLCQNPANTTSRELDNTVPPSTCDSTPAHTQDQTEIGWIDSGGGFSSIFSRPDFQATVPGNMAFPSNARGVPDVAYNASSRTGVLIYVSLPGPGDSGAICPTSPPSPCSTGWYIIGGTSAGSPQWAGLVALADQIKGHALGYINPALYQIANNSTMYAKDFYDVTTGGNQIEPTVPGWSSATGWDPVTGLGTPNAANLLPDLAKAVP
jgi:subtilase family serine protease